MTYYASRYDTGDGYIRPYADIEAFETYEAAEALDFNRREAWTA